MSGTPEVQTFEDVLNVSPIILTEKRKAKSPAQRQAKYRKAHKDRVADSKAQYRKRNKSKIAECKTEYYKNNQDKIKKYLHENKAKIAERAATYNAIYRQNNKEKIAADQAVYYKANKERIAARKSEYRQANKERIKIREAEYSKAHPEANRENSHRRRALRRNVEVEKFKDVEIFKRDNWTCKICHKKVNGRLKYPNPLSRSLDHIIPISKGGTHTKDNVQCAHYLCNCKKGNGTVEGGEQLLMFG